MIHLSSAAISEIKRLKAYHTNPHARLRLEVKPGGCAELYYTLTLEDAVTANDQVLTCEQIQIVVDTHTLPLVNGLTLDYSEDLMGGGFRFDNPNASQSCGCGNSFAIAN
jgi:iron-sulfur cluster assembly accessory protein